MTLSPAQLYCQATTIEPTPITGMYHFTGYGQDHVFINNNRHDGSLIVLPDQITLWPVSHFEALKAEHFTMLVAFQPEVVLFGSGTTLRFLPQAITQGLTQSGIAIETMDTQSACRTFNVLANEARRVLVALLNG